MILSFPFRSTLSPRPIFCRVSFLPKAKPSPSDDGLSVHVPPHSSGETVSLPSVVVAMVGLSFSSSSSLGGALVFWSASSWSLAMKSSVYKGGSSPTPSSCGEDAVGSCCDDVGTKEGRELGGLLLGVSSVGVPVGLCEGGSLGFVEEGSRLVMVVGSFRVGRTEGGEEFGSADGALLVGTGDDGA